MAITAKQILEALTGSEGGPEELKEWTAAIRDFAEAQSELGLSYKNLGTSGKGASKALDEAAKGTSKWSMSAEDMGQKMGSLGGIVRDADDTFLGFTGRLFESATGAENATFKFADFTKGLKSSINITNIMATVAQMMGEAMLALAYATDEAFSEFNRATGALDMFGDKMISVQRDLQPLGIGVGDITTAYTGLINNLGSFNRMSGAQQKTIAKNTAVLQELGVSADVTAANYNTLMSAFTMTEDQASKVQREMFVLAQTIGMPPEEMANGFQKAIPQLAAFGKKSTDVYKKLAVNAKAAGMTVNQLLRITEQFDTFEGAAQAVGKLNALLGGPYLSTTRMIQNTDPTERMRMLSNAINDAGKSFDQMEYYEAKATAAAMGLADVSELALLMNNRFDLLEPQTKQSAADLEALAEQTAKFNSVTEMMKSMLLSIVANLEPVIRGFKTFLGGIASFMATWPSFKLALAALALGLGAIATYLAIATGPVGILIAVISTLVIVFSLIYSYVGSFNDIMNESSGTIKFLKISIVALLAIAFWPLIAIALTLYGVFLLLKERFQVLIDVISAGIEYLDPYFDKAFENIGKFTAFMKDIYDSVMGNQGVQIALKILSHAFNLVFDAILFIFNPVLGLISLFTTVYSIFSEIYSLFSGIFDSAAGTKVAAFAEHFWSVVSPIQKVKFVLGLLGTAVKAILGSIPTLFSPLITVVDLFMAAYDAISNLHILSIIGHSPSFVEALGMVSGAFDAFGKAISAPIRAVESLFGVMKDFVSFLLSPEVMGVLGKVFETGINVVASAFGFDAEKEANKIAQARLEIEQSLADSNVALKNSIDQLTKVLSDGNTKGTGTVVNINPKMEKFFEVQEKRMERKMSSRPVYATTGGR